MNKVKSGVVRRIAVQVKQRQRRHRIHLTSICDHACEANSRRGKMKTPPRGGASVSLYLAPLAFLPSATLLTTLLLTTLLLLAGLLVRVLVWTHFSLSNMFGSALITRAP